MSSDEEVCVVLRDVAYMFFGASSTRDNDVLLFATSAGPLSRIGMWHILYHCEKHLDASWRDRQDSVIFPRWWWDHWDDRGGQPAWWWISWFGSFISSPNFSDMLPDHKWSSEMYNPRRLIINLHPSNQWMWVVAAHLLNDERFFPVALFAFVEYRAAQDKYVWGQLSVKRPVEPLSLAFGNEPLSSPNLAERGRCVRVSGPLKRGDHDYISSCQISRDETPER
jgi:hypothetical protein